MKLEVIILLFLTIICFSYGFIWELDDNLPASKILTFSERYMFADHDGPDVLSDGESYIRVLGSVSAYMNQNFNHSVEVTFAIYAASDKHHHDSLTGMCGIEGSIQENSWASSVKLISVPTAFIGSYDIDDPFLNLNGTYHQWDATLDHKYLVQEENWHNVAFQVCTAPEEMPLASLDSVVTFKNPYGYLPAELYGFLPFEFMRALAFIIFGIWFSFLFCRFRDSVIPLHYAILTVFLFAAAEASTWFGAYTKINRTGQPYCCPFPSEVVGALVLQVFRQTFSRTLLLIVALGYGIVRPKLLPTEWTAVVVVASLYFVCAFVSEVTEIVLVNDVHLDAPQSVTGTNSVVTQY